MTKRTPIRVGVIGLGAIGERMMNQFRQHPETEIVAVCDISEARAQQVAKTLGDIPWYTSHNDLLANGDVDLVYVAVPPALHHAIALDAIYAGKHILCEKPLANSLEEAKAMLEAAERSGLVHAINFPMHHSPSVYKFERLLSDGYLGDLRRVEITMHFPQWPRTWQQNNWVGGRKQGGFILEAGVHFIQITQRLFGEIQNISSKVEYPDNPELCEIGILATMELADGTPVLINGLSHIAEKERVELFAYGTDGTLALVNWDTLMGAKRGESLTVIEPTDESPDSVVASVVKAIRGEPSNLCDFRVGYSAQIVLEQLRRPSSENR